jgi:2-polyprenyl-3-methyl-5-hydroxy-6-metoxy-1,4-benzoquinol methylase
MMKSRKLLPEIMDTPGLNPLDLSHALDELETINRWLGGYRTTRKGVEELSRHINVQRTISILDIAAGGSDLETVLHPLGRPYEVTALDINDRLHEYRGRNGHGARFVLGSAHDLPFADRSFDVVHVSLFLHHCTDEQARVLLAGAIRIARYGIVVNDLHRHPLAYAGIAILTRLFSSSAVVRHDALISVGRAFTRSELLGLLPRSDGRGVSVSWCWAFRWCLCISTSPSYTYD